ncbi:exodeoxyribonuclease III [Halieaceae bacterium IMCC14734]|uniref:Exodeoxyribonuclease III n=1 Tax=Candidatus Litorirhabdus singularis TaxID=2518993 RepID=A0ABT3TG06_9GAMM|nr:exodeoxyribonuclease III [Candidatus Litorirhabdus singularis]MCX2981213.1 exodeoxyribonuclease III [Candidatus Litorirhabdus singularis]
MASIITFNANGIRSAARKGFFEWMLEQNADVVCVQETKAQEHQLDDAVFHPAGYHCFYNDAEKKGYSGTAIYSRIAPREVISSLGWDPADSEGRYLQADFEKFSVISLYLPSGSSSDEGLAKKYRFMDAFYDHLASLRRKRREFVICADWNICHKEIDLKNWRPNRKNSGFLPAERAWLSRVYDELGYVDSFREINQLEEQYTWWSNRGQAYANNVGWRLDYQVITPGLRSRVRAGSIYREQKFSDHAPHTMEFDWDINP